MIRQIYNKFYEFFLKKKFIYNSRKISSLIKKIINKNFYFYIVDVGAGARYLPSVLNFDGSSKVFMIDPNKNLEVSTKNLIKIIKYKENIIPINIGLYNKNTTLNYYLAPIPTSSSFINYDKTLKSTKKKVSKFSDIKKKYKIKKVDILKIDVEGLELEILKIILKNNLPLIIEVESNFKDSPFGDTFSQIHSLLSKKYFLKTSYSTYKNSDKKFNSHLKPFIYGSYHSPSYRSPIYQMDCYYILKKNNYNLNDLILLLGYGFIDDAIKIFEKIKKNLNQNQVDNINNLLKIFYEK